MWLLAPLAKDYMGPMGPENVLAWLFLQLSRPRISDLLDRFSQMNQWQQQHPTLHAAVFEEPEDVRLLLPNQRVREFYEQYCNDQSAFVPLPEELDPRSMIVAADGRTVTTASVHEEAIEETRSHFSQNWVRWSLIEASCAEILWTPGISRAKLLEWATHILPPVPVPLPAHPAPLSDGAYSHQAFSALNGQTRRFSSARPNVANISRARPPEPNLDEPPRTDCETLL